MKHCPNCGAKDFSSDHRGSYSKEPCSKCGGNMAKPNAKAPLGQGGRFAAMEKKVGSPALAAFIGRKKYGAKKMAAMAAKGKKQAKGNPFYGE